MNNIILDKLEIMAEDLPNKMPWTSVPGELEALGGNGWRLPTELEFKTIYNFYKLGIGGFKPGKYWAASSSGTKAWYYNLSKGYSPHITDQSEELYVRLVRSI
jgi:hypothetical protein